jgi:tetratricopeptide (TPR) repeat protein
MQKDDQEYFGSKHFLELLKTYEDSANSGHPVYMDADDLADIADYYQFNGRQADAEEAIRLAEKFNDHAVGPLLYRAREALVKKDFDTARDYVGIIKVVDDVEAHFLKGEILVCEGKTEEADELFRQYLKDEVPDDEAMDYIYDVANIFSEYNVFDKALEWMFRSKGDDSDDFKELMARVLFGLGKYKDSEKIFNELIDHNPYSNKYWNALASTQFMLEDYSSAITSSEYAIAIDPNDADGLLSKANSLFNLDNYEAALACFEKYSEKMPDDEFGHLHQGTCLLNTGRYEDAIKRLKKAEMTAKEGSPYLPEIYQELAFAYSELQQPETAVEYLDKTEDLDCDHINMQITKGHVMLANNKKNEAEKLFKKALEDSDNSPHVMLRIIVSLYDNKYLSSTYNLMKNFLNNMVDEDWKDGYSYMALCCMELKKYDEALEYIKIACEKNPKEAKVALNSYFPKDMEPKDYYDYLINKLKES